MKEFWSICVQVYCSYIRDAHELSRSAKLPHLHFHLRLSSPSAMHYTMNDENLRLNFYRFQNWFSDIFNRNLYWDQQKIPWNLLKNNEKFESFLKANFILLQGLKSTEIFQRIKSQRLKASGFPCSNYVHAILTDFVTFVNGTPGY